MRKFMYRMIPIFLFLIGVIGVQSQNSWVVNTQYGDVRGFWSDEMQSWRFLGVPFAAPPVGSLRFKAPVPPVPWTDVLDANRTISCTTSNSANTEDCLIVNVFVPESARTRGPLPVLFYGYGGAFIGGNSFNYNTRATTRFDVIFVSYNYRLGPFGYLCLGTERVPGNAGLKDYVAALRWVNKNIENFGGDPNAVTLFGVSAGAVNTEAMVITRATDGLIRGAIFESGSVLADWAVNYNRLGLSKAVALNLHCPHVDDLDELAKCYESFSVSEIQQYMRDETRQVICLEREIEGEEAIVTEDYHHTMEIGDHKHIPVMLVYTTLDGLQFSNDFDRVQQDFDKEISKLLSFNLRFESPAQRNEVVQSIKAFYFEGPLSTNDSFLNYATFRTDLMFYNPVFRSAVMHSRWDEPVYLMEFSYKGNYARPNNPPTYDVAGHADVGSHVVGLNTYGTITPTDDLVRDRMTEMWTNFVKYGTPVPEDSSLNIEWPEFTEEEQHYLWMGREPEVRQFPWRERTQFWLDLYEKYYFTAPKFENSGNKISASLLLTTVLGIFLNRQLNH